MSCDQGERASMAVAILSFDVPVEPEPKKSAAKWRKTRSSSSIRPASCKTAECSVTKASRCHCATCAPSPAQYGQIQCFLGKGAFQRGHQQGCPAIRASPKQDQALSQARVGGLDPAWRCGSAVADSPQRAQKTSPPGLAAHRFFPLSPVAHPIPSACRPL